MTQATLAVELLLDDGSATAQYYTRTGRLVVRRGETVIEDIPPPDSWMALSGNERSAWGTKPSVQDLSQFLERFISNGDRFAGRRNTTKD
jgi:hypothetical protein